MIVCGGLTHLNKDTLKTHSNSASKITVILFVGHFTQVVWKGTTEAGFGIAQVGKGKE